VHDGDNTSFLAASATEKTGIPPTSDSNSGIQILDWDGPNDPTNPRNFSNTRKWIITGCALLGTLLLPLNGTSITVAHEELAAGFNFSEATFPHSYWTVTSWSVGGAIFIVVGFPLLEDLGVRLGYFAFYTFFLLMIIPQAVAQNLATLIVTRFFSGGCVTLLANTVASVIPDIWEDDKARSLPVGIWILFYLMGSTLGPPMFSGVIQHIGNWRWIFYIQLIIYGALFPLFYFTIAETRPDVILRRRAKKLRKQTGKQIYAKAELNQRSALSGLGKTIYRPVYLLVTEPVLIASTFWSAFSFGTVFLFTQSTEQVYIGLYGWHVWSTGYIQLAIVIGEIFGWVASLYGTHVYLNSASRNTETPGHPIPEARLYVSIFGSFVGIAGGMFVYAWTSYPSLPWIAPSIGLGMVGFGIQTVVSAVADYIEDAYAASGCAGSAISGVAAGENIVAGFVPLATQSMYRTLGFQWASSLLAFIALLLSMAPVIFVWKGRTFRERSPFMLSGGKTYGSALT
jgi:MFS family permease